jgi:hypothetical protein
VNASDACGGTSIALLSVTSDEPDDAPGRGDGRTINDIQGVELGSEDYEVRLRAERSGFGDGRTYTITYEATDGSGLTTPGTARVFVPHSRAGRCGGARCDEESPGDKLTGAGLPRRASPRDR